MKEGLPTSEELEALYQHMIDIATRMDFYGGFSEVADHGRELICAAAVVGSWVDGMKEQEAGNA